MRVGLDYTPALRQRAGIGRYTRGIIGALAALDRENDYHLLLARDARPLPRQPWPANMRFHGLPFSDRVMTIIWHRLRLPLYVNCLSGPIDIYHAPDFVLPPVAGPTHTILTVHDLSFLRYPECADARLVAYLSRAVPRSLARADCILADSASTKHDLVELLGVAPERVTVVPAGVGPEYRLLPAQSLAAVSERYRLPQQFILHVGTLEPRKNLLRLLHAFAGLRAVFPALHLVLVGGRGWLYQEIFDTVERLGLREAVVFPGYVAEADLPAIYNLAAVFAFPSLYEGFGLPPLEAMACGTPVVCSDSSSLPEVMGEAALLVPPTDTDALAAALQRALQDDDLRATLRERGLAQAQHFTWGAAAHLLMDVYRSCASG